MRGSVSLPVKHVIKKKIKQCQQMKLIAEVPIVQWFEKMEDYLWFFDHEC